MICDFYISEAFGVEEMHAGALTLTPTQLVKLVARRMPHPDYYAETNTERTKITVYIGGCVEIRCAAPTEDIEETICKLQTLGNRVFDRDGNLIR